MHKVKFAGLLLGAVVAAMFLVPGVASAHHRAWTGIKISFVPDDPGQFAKPIVAGVLQSNNEGCEVGREVIVKKARKHRPNKVVNVDISSLRGAWSVTNVSKLGLYHVKVNKTAYCTGAKASFRVVAS